MLEHLIDAFSERDDPRCDSKVEHNLLEMLIMAICGVIAGAESWEDMALYAQRKEAWLRSFLTLKNGIPSHDTFRRVFMLIDPTQFEQSFRQWVGQWLGTNPVGHVAIDGKTGRHAFDRKRDQSPLQQVACLGKSNDDWCWGRERWTAHPTRSPPFQLSSQVWIFLGDWSPSTLQAERQAITQAILEQHADYVVTVKGRQKRTLRAVETWFEEHAFAVPSSLKPVLDTFDDSHGRLTRRRVLVHPAPTELKVLEAWPGIKSILAVESIRMVKPHGAVTAEKRYFLSSVPVEDERQIVAIRQHWSIENRLHSRVGCHVSRGCFPRPRPACSTQSRLAAKNRLQSDPAQHDCGQCPR